MSRLQFGAFLAPHHPLGESPTRLLRRDLDLAAHLDQLGFDEFWVGEHHSTGWEMIASPELFLAAAAERTRRIRLGTGVVSLPYHHPFTVAQRLVQLDHQSEGRLMFGSGPGALPSDGAMLMLDPMRQRDMQDEALGVIIRLLEGETVSYETDWFRMREARLQILPHQERIPMTVASSISPSGMRLAGKYGIGALSIASTSTEGLLALPTQWSFAEESAAEHGRTVDRANWRVLLAWHLASSRDKARDEAVDGLQNWNNNYNAKVLGRPDAVHTDDKWALLDGATQRGASGAGAAIIGTPDDAIEAIRNLLELTGGFGTAIGFVHDWADRDATFRSWELFSRYVVPELQGTLLPMRASADHVSENKATLMAGAGAAIFAQIQRSDRAQAEFTITLENAARAHAEASGVGQTGVGSSAAAASAFGKPDREGDER
jgi:limonene 1,2-monooxygenase